MTRRALALLPAACALLAFPGPLAGAVGEAFVPITACRAVDTRNPAGPLGGPALGASEARIFTIAGTCGVPADALGLTVNLTVVGPAAAGFAKLYAGDAASPPGTSVLNFTAGRTRASNAFVALASDGSGTVTLVNGSAGSAHYLVDVTSYLKTACVSTIVVSNPSTAAGTVNSPFSQTFTQTGGTGTTTFSTASPLPAGLALASNGTLSGTPTQPGSFPITVVATDANGCTGTGPTYTLVIACQTVSVTNPATATGVANAPFSQTFTQTGGAGATTFTTASPLPIGLSLAANGVLSGTPTQAGGFPIVVTATDSTGCTGTGATYDLVISCQTISVTNPANAAGTAGAAFSRTFTQAGAIGTATFTTASPLPNGLALAPTGVLSGTPTQTGLFPIVVTVTDGNLCTGTGATYNLAIGCQTITVGNPATTSGVANTPFSQAFTQVGAIGSATFTTASTLPTGLALAANGVLSGTPTQTGTFPIVVTVTDANGCTGTGATYNLVIACQSFTVNPASLPQGTTGVSYPAVVFSHAGGIGAVTFAQTGALPSGMNFTPGTATLDGTPTQSGSFPVTVTATDANGCTASRDYLLVVVCSGSSITLSPASLPTVTVGNAFPATVFTASGGTGPYTFAKAGALPGGMNFNPATATLDGTPTETGSFPITISATDTVGLCVGSQDYVVNVTCNGVTITVAPATIGPAPAGAPFSQTFTPGGGTSPYTFAATGALPTGMTFAAGVLSGTPTLSGTFPITVTAIDASGCVGSTTYSLVITCPIVTVTNPGTTTGTVSTPFSQTFTQSGGALPVTFSLASGTPPAGLTLDASTGILSGTPTQSGTFPITVKATDANGCTGTGPTYTLVIACQTITVTNPVVNSGADGAPFLQTFTQTGAIGGATFTLGSGSLPSGWSLTPAGALANAAPTPAQFTITVMVTDGNGCTGTGASYTVTILPNVVADTYTPAIVGNMSIDTATGTTFSVLTNDSAGTTANLVGGGTTAQGGAVTLDALGRFTYNPPRGYEGPDSFQYTATHTASGLTSAPATVSLTVTGMVWFVNDNAGACVSTCDGRRTNPYTALDLFQAVNDGTPTNPKAGDSIFLYESAAAYTGPAAAPVALLNNQKLLGQDFAGTFAAATGLTVPDTTVAVPVLTPGAPFSNVASVPGQNIVLLASGNTLRGLTLSPANNAAIAFVGPGSIGTATVDQVILSLAGSGSGIGLALHTGTLNVQNSSIIGGGTGTAVAVSGAANGSVLFTNTPVTRTAGRLLDVQSRTAGGAVTFDAASVLTLTGAATDGIVLQNNASTTLSLLGGFSVTTTAGRGFFANNTGTVTIGGASNLINATGGAALDVTSTTIAGSPTFTSVSSTNPATQGILLSNAGGGFTIGTTTVSGSGTQRILVTGSTVSASFGNTTLNGGSDAVSLQNNSAGTRSFGTLTIGNTTPPTGVGLLHSAGGGATTVTGATTITNPGGNGIDIQNSTSAITFNGVTISKNNAGLGVNLVNDSALTTFGSLSISSVGTAFSSSTASVSTNGGTINANGASAILAVGTNFNASTLASVSASGGVNGISLATSSGSLSMTNGSITGATGVPFVVNGGTVSATYGGGITQSAANAMVSVSGGHATGTITFQGGTLSATNGTGLQFDNADGTYNFNGTTTLNGGDAGIDVQNGSSGSFTFGSGAAITNPSGIAYREDTSTATVNYDGTITKTNNAANAVDINAKTGGSTTFSGAISASTTTANAIDLTNTGGTVTFRGGLSATTTSGVAFNATGAGATVAVCDENPCNPAATGALVNTLTSTTGTALNVANTSIGSNSLEFKSISSNGGANGIFLQNTGSSGGLKVVGDNANTARGGNASGGTIQNMVGADGATAGNGIYLDNTQKVSLKRMQLNGFDNSAIRGFNVTDFTLQYCTINGTSGNNTGATEGAVTFGTISGTNGLSGGTNLVDNCKISGAIEHNMEFYNYQAGSNYSLTVSNSDIKSNSVAGGSDGFQMELGGSYANTATVLIQGCAFDDNKSQGVQASALGGSNLDITIDQCTLTRTSQGNEGFLVTNGANAHATVHMTNNILSGIGGTALFVGQVPGNASASSSLTAVIKGNTVTHGTTATNHSISVLLSSTVGQTAPANILVESNVVTQNSTSGTARGILVDTPDTSTTPSFTATILNNSVAVGDNVNGVAGLVAQSRRAGACFDIRSNVVTFPNGTPAGIQGMRLRQVAPGTANLEQGAALLSDPASTVLQTNNSGSGTTTEVLGAVTVVNNSGCPTPPS